MRPALLLAAAGIGAPLALQAQSVTVGAARWLTSPRVSEYRIGIDGFSLGPLSYRPTFQYLHQAGESRAVWGGAGADLILRTTPTAMPYLIGGLGVGFGRAAQGGLGPSVGAWGGVGAELVAFGPMALQAEALYTWRSKTSLQSVSLGLRIGTRIGRQIAKAPSPESTSMPASGLPGASPQDEATIRAAMTANVPAPAGPTSAASGVVSTALSVMGTPYRWGGTDLDGFDCSGLIQYSYAQHGVTLPRTSLEQAQAGSEVGRNLDQLLPGDILTFAAEPGGSVAHVGLYLGDGRFIHSANGGVQTSRLSADDSSGKWWWARWVGARRVLE